MNSRSSGRTFRHLDEESAGTGRARIVIADDSTALRMVVRITVESEGWTVVEAPTGDAALALVREQPPDLLLLDLDFGEAGLDGLEVLRQIRADRRTTAVPVVILTANERPDIRTRAMALGADEFLTKPFGPLDLLVLMRGILRREPEVPRLGLHLVQSGALTPERLRTALELQRERQRAGTPIALGALLVEFGMVSKADVDAALRSQHAEGR
ncbi:MAG TPA: response regulator [Candidatus Limnocylindria bacterium]